MSAATRRRRRMEEMGVMSIEALERRGIGKASSDRTGLPTKHLVVTAVTSSVSGNRRAGAEERGRSGLADPDITPRMTPGSRRRLDGARQVLEPVRHPHGVA